MILSLCNLNVFVLSQVGVQVDNITTLSSLNFNYVTCVGMLIFDFFLYGFLAWYLDLVLPSEFGTPLSPFFLFMPSYWRSVFNHWCSCFSSRKRGSYAKVALDETPTLRKALLAPGSSGMNNSDFASSDADFEALSNGNFDPEDANFDTSIKMESVSSELKKQILDGRAVRICNLMKRFPSPAGGEDLIAVKGLNLNLYEGQVSVLLGHNGKSHSKLA